jgi:hypothetical protein
MTRSILFTMVRSRSSHHPNATIRSCCSINSAKCPRLLSITPSIRSSFVLIPRILALSRQSRTCTPVLMSSAILLADVVWPCRVCRAKRLYVASMSQKTVTSCPLSSAALASSCTVSVFWNCVGGVNSMISSFPKSVFHTHSEVKCSRHLRIN